MNVQYLSNEKGERTGVYISMKDWEEIQKKLEYTDFWDDLPDHVKDSIDEGLKQSEAGQTKSHEEVMRKFSRYLWICLFADGEGREKLYRHYRTLGNQLVRKRSQKVYQENQRCPETNSGISAHVRSFPIEARSAERVCYQPMLIILQGGRRPYRFALLLGQSPQTNIT